VRAQGDRRAAEREEFAARLSTLAGQAEASGGSSRRPRRAGGGRGAGRSGRRGPGLRRGLLHAREQAAKEGRAAGEARRRELQERELHLARLDADLEHLDGACRSDLGRPIEALRASPAVPDGERTLQEEEAEHESIKKDLDAMGPINLMAIEQYTELEERFNFLVAQKTDLDGSIASLRETIRKINRQSRERFLAAFKRDPGRLPELLRGALRGGRAELRLEEGEEDVLEAGVEIAASRRASACRRWPSCPAAEGSHGSGAPVLAVPATALTFCVLRRVDAPLDEANVERSRGFSRSSARRRSSSSSRTSQEHEAADLLYGITMEEPAFEDLPLHFE